MRIAQRKLTVVGAGYVGMTCAQLAAQKNLAGEIVVIDIDADRAKGIALDLNQMAAVEGFGTRLTGTGDPAATADSDLVILTAGRPRKPGMSRSDLLETNGKIVREVADYVRTLSPETVVIVVTNPLDSMVHLMRVATGFPGRRVIGMAGVLDAARFSWFIAEETGSSVIDVDAMVLGAHGDSMVPLPKACTVNGVSLPQLVSSERIAAMADRTRKGGAEIVALLKTGSAFFAPAAASVAMAASILNDQRRILPCACLLNGEYGFEGIYMGVPAVLGAGGVERVLEIPLETESRMQMQKTAGEIHKDLATLRELDLI
jgi:malate dehydrogenase